jgi:hypothetical protein
VFVEELPSPSIKQLDGITLEPPASTTQIMVITRSWTQDFIDYIKENKLLANRERGHQDNQKKQELHPCR